MQIEDALAMFTLQLEANGRSRNTVLQFRRHLLLLARWHGGDLGSVTPEVVARFLTSPEARLRSGGRPRKTSVVNALRHSIRGFFSFCITAGLIERDPARLVRRARCGPPPPRTLSDDDQRRLLFVLSKADDPEGRRDRALFELMLRTGIRIGSAVALDVEDADLERGELWLRTTKGDRPDRVFLPGAVVELLRGYLAGRTAGPLFPGQRGERITARHAGRRLKVWLKAARIDRPASPHTLRHTFATGLYRRTGDILLVQAALRHRSIGSTLVYAHLDPERLRQAMA